MTLQFSQDVLTSQRNCISPFKKFPATYLLNPNFRLHPPTKNMKIRIITFMDSFFFFSGESLHRKIKCTTEVMEGPSEREEKLLWINVGEINKTED